MDVNGEDSTNTGRWEVVEVIGDINNRNLHPDIICPDGLKYVFFDAPFTKFQL